MFLILKFIFLLLLLSVAVVFFLAVLLALKEWHCKHPVSGEIVSRRSPKYWSSSDSNPQSGYTPTTDWGHYAQNYPDPTPPNDSWSAWDNNTPSYNQDATFDFGGGDFGGGGLGGDY